MPAEHHTFMDGRLHVYRRANSRFWQCAIYLGGYNHRQTTGHDNLALAVEWAKDWGLERLADDRMRRRGLEPIAPDLGNGARVTSTQASPARAARGGKTFRHAAEVFLAEFTALAGAERNADYVASKGRILRLHLLPFLGKRKVREVTAGVVADYRVHRLTPPETPPPPARPMVLKGRARLKRPRPWRRPARNTLHSEIVCLRQVLKTANRQGWIAGLPDMSAPYKASGKVSHRGWFSLEEYTALYQATRERARHPERERWRAAYEDLHDYVLIMGNSGLRPDEAARVQVRDVEIARDPASGEDILEIAVRGKRGVGYCKSMPGAVWPFRRLVERRGLRPQDLVFGRTPRRVLNRVLNDLGLKVDREGQPRTAYSLRHTYICLRLLEGADIYQLAKNCRTSVEMIERYYAVHLKDMLDTAAINVRRRPAGRRG